MRRYPLSIGSLFGALQTGYFLQLSFAFSSAAITLFSVTLAWLAGSGVGLWVAGHWRLRWWQVGLVSLGSYLVCCTVLIAFPLQDHLLPLYVCTVILSGLYAGWFFGRAAAQFVGRIDRLFFWENNGFLVGIAMTTLIYVLAGRLALWVIPIALTALSFPSSVHQGEGAG